MPAPRPMPTGNDANAAISGAPSIIGARRPRERTKNAASNPAASAAATMAPQCPSPDPGASNALSNIAVRIMDFLEQSTEDQRAVGAVPAGLHHGSDFQSSLGGRHANGQFSATAQRDDQPRFGAGIDHLGDVTADPAVRGGGDPDMFGTHHQ